MIEGTKRGVDPFVVVMATRGAAMSTPGSTAALFVAVAGSMAPAIVIKSHRA
jgi:hypothetical protein